MTVKLRIVTMQTVLYEFKDSLYINLTNRCSNSCDFCIRNFKDGVNGNPLWLDDEPTAAEVVAMLDRKDLSAYKEVVFCGFGEPTCALPVLVEVARYLKSRGAATRINTNGQANLINGVDNAATIIAPVIDHVSVSLNASNAEKYQSMCHSEFGEAGFDAMLTFTRQCVEAGIDTAMTVVDCIGAKEIEACRTCAESVGAKFRVRPLVSENDEY